MEPQESAVQYNRWNNSQDEVSMNVLTPESSGCERVYNKLCTRKLGIAMKVVGGIVLFWVIFIISYITGYHVHNCK
ncbi:small integral membrane protein 1-like [Monodelphis domestica]|uniref:Small integral membrane protein 1-like n=1 Tax=Monodelphis domestica TaxID=13616 RepID=A0A5F8H6W5_MONDO|nr:small integral membrane protein 1-like [Monodelphis domestica]